MNFKTGVDLLYINIVLEFWAHMGQNNKQLCNDLLTKLLKLNLINENKISTRYKYTKKINNDRLYKYKQLQS